jgi:hypothetical protein
VVSPMVDSGSNRWVLEQYDLGDALGDGAGWWEVDRGSRRGMKAAMKKIERQHRSLGQVGPILKLRRRTEEDE